MYALLLENIKSDLSYCNVPFTEQQNEITAKVVYAALNRRDYFIQQGLYPGIECPCILGSDASVLYNEKEYIINPNFQWGASEEYQSRAYHILGMPRNGSFAEYVSIPNSALFEKPAHLSMSEAAALPLAGLTAYRALFKKTNITRHSKVFVSGFGGGVASMAFLMAKALGCKVWVSSGSEWKRKHALELGAESAIDYRESSYGKRVFKETGGMDIIIDSAGGKGFNELVEMAAFGAHLSVYGGTNGRISFSPQIFFWRQLHIHGSTMGSDNDFKEMLDFVSHYQIRPLVHSEYPLKDGNLALNELMQSDQLGKILLRIG